MNGLTDTRVRLEGSWLIARFNALHTVASWAIVGGGLGETCTVAWRQVQERELSRSVDAAQWLQGQLRASGLEDAVGLLTSRRLDTWTESLRVIGNVRAHSVATVGLDNALRVGDEPTPYARVGTINVLCKVDVALSALALLEALAIAAEARTAAILEVGVASSRSGKPATGTGTDCIVIASPKARAGAPYAGKHTDIGAAIGAAVLDAVRVGARAWQNEHGVA